MNLPGCRLYWLNCCILSGNNVDCPKLASTFLLGNSTAFLLRNSSACGTSTRARLKHCHCDHPAPSALIKHSSIAFECSDFVFWFSLKLFPFLSFKNLICQKLDQWSSSCFCAIMETSKKKSLRQESDLTWSWSRNQNWFGAGIKTDLELNNFLN